MSATRRQFLRNTALASVAAAIPSLASAGNASTDITEGNCYPTTLDYYGQGPFYTPNAPMLVNNQLASNSEPGQRLIISGRVRTLDCSLIIPNTKIDIWHANSAGAYDNAGFNLRGVTYSNAQGFYQFETIFPGKYLNGAMYRPRHIHFKITPPGFPTLTTQLYFEGDTDIPADAAASISNGTYDASHRIIPVSTNPDNKLEGTWDIIVDGSGSTGLHELHLESGMLYSVSPNPFASDITIHYGLFIPAKVCIEVFDMSGRQIAILDEQMLTPQKYKAHWSTSSLPPGVYWITLKVNDLQVHYQKIVKA